MDSIDAGNPARRSTVAAASFAASLHDRPCVGAPWSNVWVIAVRDDAAKPATSSADRCPGDVARTSTHANPQQSPSRPPIVARKYSRPAARAASSDSRTAAAMSIVLPPMSTPRRVTLAALAERGRGATLAQQRRPKARGAAAPRAAQGGPRGMP